MLTGAAQAAELTLAQEGRIKVSQCYATCLADATRLYPTYLGASLDVWEAFLEGKPDAANDFREWACDFTQIRMTAIDTCESSCRDMQTVYGTINSWAKTRLLYVFNRYKAAVKQAGLWSSYKDFPRRGTYEFVLACDRYFDEVGGGANPGAVQ